MSDESKTTKTYEELCEYVLCQYAHKHKTYEELCEYVLCQYAHKHKT